MVFGFGMIVVLAGFITFLMFLVFAMPGYVMACVGRPRQTGPMGSNRRRLLVFGFRQVSTFFDVILCYPFLCHSLTLCSFGVSV